MQDDRKTVVTEVSLGIAEVPIIFGDRPGYAKRVEKERTFLLHQHHLVETHTSSVV